MKGTNLILAAFAGALAVSCTCSGPKEAETAQTFENPVIQYNCPDPTILDNRARDGWFYLYSTQNGANEAEGTSYLPIHRSKDLVNWEKAGDGFGPGRPQWEPGARIWAPDINYVDGKYVLFYALGVWGDGEKSASGVAVSDSPTGPFEDKGMIVSYASTGVKNSIDPNYFEDGGRKYLYWGSLGGDDAGIYVVELSDDALSIREGSKPVKLAGNDMEGTYVHRHGDWIYLFASEGSCCVEEKSTYRIIVGRSKNPLGPFVSKDGQSMIAPAKDYAQIILNHDDELLFAGPGHNAEIVTDDAGQDWMPMHTYWKGNGYKGRCMALCRVLWSEDGWPSFPGGVVQPELPAPVLKAR